MEMKASDDKQKLTDVADKVRMKIPEVLHRILNFETEQYGNLELHINKINRQNFTRES